MKIESAENREDEMIENENHWKYKIGLDSSILKKQMEWLELFRN